MDDVLRTLSLSYDEELEIKVSHLSPRTMAELAATIDNMNVNNGNTNSNTHNNGTFNGIGTGTGTSSNQNFSRESSPVRIWDGRSVERDDRNKVPSNVNGGRSMSVVDGGRSHHLNNISPSKNRETNSLAEAQARTDRTQHPASHRSLPPVDTRDSTPQEQTGEAQDYDADIEPRHGNGDDDEQLLSPPCSEIHMVPSKLDEYEVHLNNGLVLPSLDDNISIFTSDLSFDTNMRDTIMDAAISATTRHNGSLSPNTLNARADAIILEAHMACSQVGSVRGATEDDNEEQLKRRARINQALYDARRCAESRSVVSAITLTDASVHSRTLTVASELMHTPVPTRSPRVRSTREVLEMATSVLSRPEYRQPMGKDKSAPRQLSSDSESVDGNLTTMGGTSPIQAPSHRSIHHPSQNHLSRATGSGVPASPEQSPTTIRCNSPIPAEMPLKRSSSKSAVKPTVVKSVTIEDEMGHERKPRAEQYASGSFGGFSLFNYLWGRHPKSSDDENDESLGPMACVAPKLRGDPMDNIDDGLPAMATSLVRVMSDPLPPTFAETVTSMKSDPRMPMWIDNQYELPSNILKDNAYYLGSSRSVIVHEIQRGDWTWSTAWSPDGNYLAIGTENHHLAVIDTKSSSVWRVRHDKRISGPMKKDTTNSIRCIAWGKQFIAIGGTGNAVSILAPSAPYPILHTIKATGFVGSMHWLPSSNTLAIASRNGKAQIIKIWVRDEVSSLFGARQHMQEITSMAVHTIDRKDSWVNAVKFSPGGTAVAVGDGSGVLGVYSYVDHVSSCEVASVANFKVEDAILDVEWSSDGEWLYAGGEDNIVTVVSTAVWEIVHRIKRDRWVQFISSSNGGSHVAIGGVSSEVSILEVEKGWETAINVSLKGLVPLSASWHPQDQYLVLTGQNDSVLAVETTNARYVSGHFLKSISPVLAVEFSPDGRMAVIGNEAGVVTIFKLTGTCFTVCYELVLDCDGSLSVNWSANGAYLAVATGNKMVIIAHAESTTQRSDAPPNASGFSILRVIRDLGKIHAVTIHPQSRYLAVSGTSTRILDASQSFRVVREWKKEGNILANAWSFDGSWLATLSSEQDFTVYDMTSDAVAKWKEAFSVEISGTSLALAWSPVCVNGLQYCAFGGENKELVIMEIRNKERTWEVVLNIPRAGVIYDLDWNTDGLVSAAVGDGTVSILDLSYLQSGYAVNEMNYNWQRQALTCFTEIRRNRGKNCMRTVRWIPSAPGSDSLIAIGGTDGELEIVDLTEKQRCSGFNNARPIM